MHQALRPYVTTGVALVGASVLVAAPLAVPPQALKPLELNIAVQPTAAVSALIADFLADFSTVTVAGGNAVRIGTETLAGLPLGVSAAAAAIINDPSVTPDVLNYLINSFLSPTGTPAGPSVFGQLGQYVIGPLISILPPELQVVVGGALAQISTALAQGLAQLPGNTAIGLGAVVGGIALLPPGLFDATSAIGTLGTGLAEAIGGGFEPAPGFPETVGLAGWLGASPTLLLATLQAGLNNPSEIPGLASYLVGSLISPTQYPYSLFVNAFAPVLTALGEVLPTPLANVLAQVSAVVNQGLIDGLAHLPTPISPFTLMVASVERAPEAEIQPQSIASADTGVQTNAAAVVPTSPLEQSADVLLAAVRGLPAGLEGIAALVENGILTVPEAAGLLTSQLLGTAGLALQPIITDAIVNAPSPIGGTTGVVAKGAAVLGEVVADIQEKITPTLPQAAGAQRSIAGDPAGTSGAGPTVSLKLPTAKPKLNVLKLNPLDSNTKAESSAATGTSTSTGAGTAIANPLKNLHLPAPGKISVADLAKKLGLPGGPAAQEKAEATSSDSGDE